MQADIVEPGEGGDAVPAGLWSLTCHVLLAETVHLGCHSKWSSSLTVGFSDVSA